MNELNNARIRCYGRLAVHDFEVVDVKQEIWKGQVVWTQDGESEKSGVVYFSRKYDRVNNDIDRMLAEHHVKDTTIIGVEFLLVPKEKILFAYEPPSSIVRPQLRPIRPMMGGNIRE